MTVRTTRLLGDPVLRTPCTPVEQPADPYVAEVAADLADTLADWVRRTTYGRGIAAPQVGVSLRLLHLNLTGPWTLANPVVTARSATTWEPWEACLSFSLAFFCRVPRHTWVEVGYQSLDGRDHALRADGPLAHVLQHEIDHLEGLLAVDRMADPATLCMRPEFERRHREDSPYQQ